MIITNIGYNPITKEKENITEWLKDKDNLVFIIDDNKIPVCLPRLSFNLDTIPNNYILHLCNIYDYKYVKEIFTTKTKFIDIGKLNLTEKTVIDYNDFLVMINYKTTNKNQQVFLITTIISAPPLVLFTEDTVININKFHKALLGYSDYDFHKKMSTHLLTGKKTTPEVIKMIADLDQCFLEYSQRSTDDMIVFRGMKTPFQLKLNETVISPTFLSTSDMLSEARVFSDYSPDAESLCKLYKSINKQCPPDFYNKTKKNKLLKPKGQPEENNKCCLYEIHITKGIPYIDMALSTHFVGEQEIFLPRNLLMTYTGHFTIPATDKRPAQFVQKITISKSTEEQFKSTTRRGCTGFKQANISHIDVIFTDETPKKSTPIKKIIKPVKQTKKCKYGERNSLGKCPPKPKTIKIKKIPVPSPKKIYNYFPLFSGPKKIVSPKKVLKLPKCSKGTRRNKKGECEKYEKK